MHVLFLAQMNYEQNQGKGPSLFGILFMKGHLTA